MMKTWKKRCFVCLLPVMVLWTSLPAQSLWHSWLQPQFLSHANARTAEVQVDYPMYAMSFDWNESLSRWDTITETTFSYVTTGGLQQRTVSEYISGNFVLDIRETHHYNFQGFDSLTLGETWNGSAWAPAYRFQRTFDGLGNITQSIGSIWNGISWDTSSGYRAIFTYHDTTEIASVIQETYSVGNGWNPNYKIEYSFDIQDRWDTVTGYTPNLGNWEPDKRLVDIGWHDFSKNQPDSGRFEHYTSAWVNLERYYVTYSLYDSQVWFYDKFSTDWDPSEKFIFNYDSYGNEILSERYEWIGVWHQAEGAIAHPTYNPSGQMTEVWREWFDGYIYRYDNKDVFSNFFVGRPEPSPIPDPITVYPNPARDCFYFQLNTNQKGPVRIAVYDLQGRLRAETRWERGEETLTFPISEAFENGTYIYYLVMGNGRQVSQAKGKVVVQR
jgi:hypothetical protein